jgi:hypothetical protein
MTNQQGWRILSTQLAGKTLTAQILNAAFNTKFGTTGDHYPGDYAYVVDKSGKPVPATNTQAAGGYDCIFIRTPEAATYKVLAPADQVSNPRAGKGRGRGANLMPEKALAATVAALLADSKGDNGQAAH